MNNANNNTTHNIDATKHKSVDLRLGGKKKLYRNLGNNFVTGIILYYRIATHQKNNIFLQENAINYDLIY